MNEGVKKLFSLGDLIRALEELPDKDKEVWFDIPEARPTTFGSDRGYYCDIAIGFEVGYGSGPKVTELLEKARKSCGETYTGWKGGEYTMKKSTRLWVANQGCVNDVRICGVDDSSWCVVLQTIKSE